MSKWFAAKRLALKFDKYNKMYNNSPQHALNIVYSGEYTEESVNTKFLAL
jgi:hypothetical protein